MNLAHDIKDFVTGHTVTIVSTHAVTTKSFE